MTTPTEPAITDEMARRFQEAYHACDGEGPGGLALCCVRTGLTRVYPLIEARIRERIAAEVIGLPQVRPVNGDEWNAVPMGIVLRTVRGGGR